jgi:hypothetical protein
MNYSHRPIACQNAVFDGDVDLRSIGWWKGGDFSSAHFKQKAVLQPNSMLTKAVFDQPLDLEGVTFGESFSCRGARFAGGATFRSATFEGEADFSDTRFLGDGDFSDAIFSTGASFDLARFDGEVSFARSTFGGKGRPAIASFAGVRFEGEKPADLSQINRGLDSGLCIRLRNTLLMNCRFDDVNWRRDKSGRIVLEDEFDLVSDAIDQHLSREVVAIAYRRLVENFDSARAYDDAEECFRGAMRLSVRERHDYWTRLAVWLYGGASDYGTSFSRPLSWWLLAVLLIFPVVIMAVDMSHVQSTLGADAASHAHSVTESSWRDVYLEAVERVQTWKVSLLMSIETATFQRPVWRDSAGIGARVIVVVETAVTAALAALFLLALRRRFRR